MNQHRLHLHAVILLSIHVAGNQNSVLILHFRDELRMLAVSAPGLHHRNACLRRIRLQLRGHLDILRAQFCVAIRHNKGIRPAAHILHRLLLSILIQICRRFYSAGLAGIHNHLVTVRSRVFRGSRNRHYRSRLNGRRMILIHIPVIGASRR